VDRGQGRDLTRRAEGSGEIEVYFDPAISLEEKMIFGKYVHEHLLHTADNVRRLRHYVCPHCEAPIADREHARNSLERWMNHNSTPGPGSIRKTADRPTILCVRCEGRVPLWDEMEQIFASPEPKAKARELDEQSTVVLDNLDKERVLVGEVISCVHLAGQIARELHIGDYGIGMEIEFKADNGYPSGQRVYLQLKSGDSYLRTRKTDGAPTLPHSQRAPRPLLDGAALSRVARHSRLRWRGAADGGRVLSAGALWRGPQDPEADRIYGRALGCDERAEAARQGSESGGRVDAPGDLLPECLEADRLASP
jgi:hypothetical protein